MKLAVCSQGELFGGVERHILDLVSFVERRGNPRPTTILFHDRELAERLRAMGHEPFIPRGRHRYDLSLVGQVRDHLAADRVDIVHAHGYKATVVCGLARRGQRWSLIKTEHGKLEATLASPVRWLKSRSSFGFEQWITRRHVDHVCYVTQDIADAFAPKHRGLARSTVANGIDPLSRADYPRPSELQTDRFNVGVVGRVTNVKGIDFAVAALGRPQVPDHVVLHIVGNGPLEETLRAQAAAAGLAERVVFHGFRRDIYDFLAHLDALLMPSHHEGLPYTLLEAWSLGRPIVASRVGGLAEVLREGPGIHLVDVGDVPAIAVALAHLAAGSPAANVPEPCPLTLEAMGGRYLEIMADAVGQTGGGREMVNT